MKFAGRSTAVATAVLLSAGSTNAFAPVISTSTAASSVGSKVSSKAATGSPASFAATSGLSSRQRSVVRGDVSRQAFALPNFGNVFSGGEKTTTAAAAVPKAPPLSNKNLVVITGASSGLGRETARDLLCGAGKAGKYHVVMACRDVEKARRVAQEEGFPETDYSILQLELSSLASVRQFVKDLKKFKGSTKPLDTLVCNAAVYLPKESVPTFTEDGFETSLGVNHLGHFLMCRLLIDDMKKAKNPRMIIVGSITGNTNTVGGGFVFPKAGLGNFKGLEQGGKKPIAMIDGKNFNGAKAYKDAKLCNMMTMLELHERYHKSTGITFSSMYPGCIAETALFRQKRSWFRTLFPVFMKYVTGGYVSQRESGERLAQCVDDPRCAESGVYWSWNGNAKQVGTLDYKTGKVTGAGGAGGEIFKNDMSDECMDPAMRKRVWDLSSVAVGL